MAERKRLFSNALPAQRVVLSFITILLALQFGALALTQIELPGVTFTLWDALVRGVTSAGEFIPRANLWLAKNFTFMLCTAGVLNLMHCYFKTSVALGSKQGLSGAVLLMLNLWLGCVYYLHTDVALPYTANAYSRVVLFSGLAMTMVGIASWVGTDEDSDYGGWLVFYLCCSLGACIATGVHGMDKPEVSFWFYQFANAVMHLAAATAGLTVWTCLSSALTQQAKLHKMSPRACVSEAGAAEAP